jgi:cytochrome P450
LNLNEENFVFESISKLEFLHAFILETMRMYPVLAVLIPRLVASKEGVFLD